MDTIRKLLVANRSEIAIRVYRSAQELGIRSVGIYTYEDRFALHRFKADEAYQIGQRGQPVGAYLDIAAIVEVAKTVGADAIHPGYGFLSEKPELARACDAAGILFVGPRAELLDRLGDKTAARQLAEEAGVPILGGGQRALTNLEEALEQAEQLGYPVILKASHGGGGRGMRVVGSGEQMESEFETARRESLNAFGSADIFLEKFLMRARHIEVQLMGDKHGNLVHLFERDCSVQRRHQKVVEIAPAPQLEPQTRERLHEAALAIGRKVGYENAGTVEFLVDDETGKFYFIEVNPRIQVEHTVTEEVTGVDIVKTQLLVAQGMALDDPGIGLPDQASIGIHGFALQCRVTTEDPANQFVPDSGRLTHFRPANGMGVRLDAGSAYSGAIVNPFYDSLLVKVTTRARTFGDALRKMDRSLREFRVRGVKTNIPFLVNVLGHPTFQEGLCTTRFIDNTPELFDLREQRPVATPLLTYIGDTVVNGNPLVEGRAKVRRRTPAPVPTQDDEAASLLRGPLREGSRDVFRRLGPEKFSQWILDEKRLLLTDTTFRDAHQSLLATRFRTHDMLHIAPSYAALLPELFSIEMWGGATFDTSMRFLKESPWERLTLLRERIPNILFQMLLRASNAVGYKNYPDNVVRAFVKEAASAGMDLFRVFDALNWTDNMQVAMDAVLDAGAICEASICYTGDIQNPNRTKYDLKYYVNLAKTLEKMGAHILAIKDMAGLCKPYAAQTLGRALKQEIGIPIHFHTHDTAGIQAASILSATDEGLDIADAAIASVSGSTSQPNLNTLNEALLYTERETGLQSERLDQISEYWRCARQFYTPFEAEVQAGTAALYNHEIPGGQYTNLYQQALALGLADRWSDICQTYADVNQLFGDIVKVTPTSKAVGDMALFMIANDLTAQDVRDGKRELAYPESVLNLMSGAMGQPVGGFPEQVKQRILGDRPTFEGRPGASLPDADFEQAADELRRLGVSDPALRDVLSYLLYPKVYRSYLEHCRQFVDTSVLPTQVFLEGMEASEEIEVDLEPGNTLIIKFLVVGHPHPDGSRHVFFEVNGQPRDVTVQDRSLEGAGTTAMRADPSDPTHISASMAGMVVSVGVQEGDAVLAGQRLLSIEAMKMETVINAEREGKVGQLLVKPGSQVKPGNLMLTIE